MKKVLLYIILFSAYFSNAQNYQCLQTGINHYFINGNGYLRGMRIDSVRFLGDTTLYYPFHSPRGMYDSGMGGPVRLDSNGGSWLGKKVMQLSNGTFIFDSYWNDSVIIKTQANVGDSWIFYRDTTDLYYTATVTGMDTLTITDTLDSVKYIIIVAHNSSGIVTTDPVDSFKIAISKNHGFEKIIDLYTFPYHMPSSIYIPGFDYFLDKVIEEPRIPIFSPSTFSQPDIYNSIFTLTTFSSPSINQLYQWNVGDVYEFSKCNGTSEPYPSCSPPAEYDMDTITSVNITGSGVQYLYSGWKASIIISSLGTFEGYSIAPNSGSLTCDTSKLINTILMPEEFGQTNLYYYWPYDVRKVFKITSTSYANFIML